MFGVLRNYNPGKFKKDLYINLCSFVFIAASGLSINIVIAEFYSFSALGFFNLLLVYFLVLSQLFSLGISLSVHKLIPQYQKDPKLYREILTSSTVLSLALAGFSILLLYLFREIPGRIMGNDLLSEGFIYLILGIGISIINRSLLSYLNGMRFMISFAFFSALRVVLMVLILFFLVFYEKNNNFLGLIFTVPEIVLAVILLFWMRNKFTKVPFLRLKKLCRIHLTYGIKGLLGTVLTSFQTKVDIFILGFFVSNELLGIYGFAVFVADGFSQIFYVFRASINPIITNIYFNRSFSLLDRFITKSSKQFYRFFVILALLLALLYPALLFIFEIKDQVFTNLLIFYILLIGIVISSGYVPFQFYFNQIGKPEIQTRFLFYNFTISVLTTLALVPIIGVAGAAMAYLTSNIFQLLYLRRKISSSLKVD